MAPPSPNQRAQARGDPKRLVDRPCSPLIFKRKSRSVDKLEFDSTRELENAAIISVMRIHLSPASSHSRRERRRPRLNANRWLGSCAVASHGGSLPKTHKKPTSTWSALQTSTWKKALWYQSSDHSDHSVARSLDHSRRFCHFNAHRRQQMQDSAAGLHPPPLTQLDASTHTVTEALARKRQENERLVDSGRRKASERGLIEWPRSAAADSDSDTGLSTRHYGPFDFVQTF